MTAVHVSDLPRFVQVRGYAKGTLVARVVVVEKGGGWLWSRPLIEGTRMDARDVAQYTKALGIDEALLAWPHLTPEMIQAAVDWHALHPRWPGERWIRPL